MCSFISTTIVFLVFIQQLPDWYNPFYFAAVTLLYTNSALNPVLYGGLNDNFRSGIKNLINSIFRRKLIQTNSNGVIRNSVISTIPDNRRESEVNILSDLHLDPKENIKKKTSFNNPVYEERSASEWEDQMDILFVKRSAFFSEKKLQVVLMVPATMV